MNTVNTVTVTVMMPQWCHCGDSQLQSALTLHGVTSESAATLVSKRCVVLFFSSFPLTNLTSFSPPIFSFFLQLILLPTFHLPTFPPSHPTPPHPPPLTHPTE